MLGVMLVNKPKGITSHDVVSRMRRTLQTRRIGHAGTLDPLATGLLVMAVGPATRFLQYLPLEPKEYVCRIRFGQETNTYDAEGDVVAEKEVPGDLENQLVEVLPDFTGEVDQLPPLFSAVKKDGKPLYAYARKGEEVERKTRTIYIEELELMETTETDARVRIVCSGGTYVRTIAHDLGDRLGCGAHVAELERTKVGKFDVGGAVELDDVSIEKLVPLSEALLPMPLAGLNYGQVQHVRHGRQVRLNEKVDGDLVGFLDLEGNVIGMGRVVGDMVQPECVIPEDAVGSTV